MKNISELIDNPSLIVNKKIVAVFRLFYEMPSYFTPLDMVEQETDGSVYLQLDNKIFLALNPDTESFSVKYDWLPLSSVLKEMKNVSTNVFWKEKVGCKITEIREIKGKALMPQGILLELENGSIVKILYISESDYTFDALVVR